MSLPLSITEDALSRLEAALKIHPEMPSVRIGIKGGGGCGGVMYSLGLDKSTEEDQTYQHSNIQFVINKGHLMHLVGLKIDYQENEIDKGFIFNKEG